MKSWIFLVLLVVYLHGTSARIHSMKYFVTTSSGIPKFPEFVADCLVDDVQIAHFDSNIKTAVPKQDWMNRVTEDDPQFWKNQLQHAQHQEQLFRADIENIKQRFNQTGGVHVYQWMFGSEWDDETGAVSRFTQIGYDGEDFLSLDLKTETWIAAKPQAVLDKQKRDYDKTFMEQENYFFKQEFPKWLKKYVNYGKSSLMKTDLPSVSLLQKTSSSPVRCFATGFYPKVASLVWRRDGVEIHEDVEHGELLPNQDGTFQMSVDLDVSSVKAEDWGRLDCVFQLSGEEDMVTRLDRAGIKTNEAENPSHTGIIVGAVIVLGVTLTIAVTGFLIYKKKKGNCSPTPERDPEVMKKLNTDTTQS